MNVQNEEKVEDSLELLEKKIITDNCLLRKKDNILNLLEI